MTSRIGSFSPYLDALNSPETPRTSSQGEALALLVELAKEDNVPLQRIQATSGFTFDQFAAALKWLQEAGFVTVLGIPGQEIVSLTPSGRTLGSVAGKPAAS